MQRINSCLRGELIHAYGYSSEWEARRYTCSRAATLIRTRFRPAGGTHNLFNDTPGHVNEPNFLIQELGRKVRSGQSPGTPASQAGQEQKEINPAPGALLLASPPPPAPEEPLGAQNHEIREPWGGPASPDSPTGGFCRSFSTQKDK